MSMPTEVQQVDSYRGPMHSSTKGIVSGITARGNFYGKIFSTKFRDNLLERAHCVVTGLPCSSLLS